MKPAEIIKELDMGEVNLNTSFDSSNDYRDSLNIVDKVI